MKTLAKLSLFHALLALLPLAVFAQSQITFTVTPDSHANAIANGSPLGRDFWFAIPENFQKNLDPTRYFYIYISSPKNATANIQVGTDPTIVRTITAGQTTVVSSVTNDFSRQAELQSSGIPESKTIHVWSKDADLHVMFLSRAPFTTDGMYCIPSSGWGTDYVVASYASFLIDVAYADLPTEFVVVANADNTHITINPTTDIRQDGFPSVIAHKKDSIFTIILNRGQCVQFQATATPGDDSWDFSGTRVQSDKPVGVIGASVCPNVTVSDNTCDHLLEMLPPIRAWGKSYLTVPFDGRTYGGDGFLVLPTKAGQVINRNGTQALVAAKPYGATYLYDISTASSWTSDTAFMLVQYIMSASRGVPAGKPRNTGDPAMVVISPVEQFTHQHFLQIPKLGGSLGGGQLDFTNYINLILPISHEASTKFDGHGLGSIAGTSTKKYAIGSTAWEGISIKYNTSGDGAGPHVVTSDTSIGAYSYGYTRDDSYAWPGTLGTRSLALLDTTAPTVTVHATDCFSASIAMKDVGANASKLMSVVTDSVYNMTLDPWPDTIIAVGDDSEVIAVSSTDQTKEAYVRLVVTDLAGNRTTVSVSTSALSGGLVSSGPSQFNFLPGVRDTITIVIHNAGVTPVNVSSMYLDQSGSIDFGILSVEPAILLPGDSATVKIRFISSIGGTFTSKLLLDTSCLHFVLDLTASSSGEVTGFKIPCIGVGSTIVDSVFVGNYGASALIVDSVWTSNPQVFSVVDEVSSGKPLTIQSGAKIGLAIKYAPSAVGNDSAFVSIHFVNGGSLTARVYACAITDGVQETTYGISGFEILPVIPNPTSQTDHLLFRYTMPRSASVKLELFDALGRLVSIVIDPHMEGPGSHSVEYALPAGVGAGTYYYRYTFGAEHLSGKVIIQ